MPPLLSICVPTYNRAPLLRVMLEALLPQVAAAGPEVELCISDNASTDATPEVIGQAQALGPFRHSRNASNLGPIGNFHRVANELARGEYVWVLGDDDLVRPGAVARVLEVLRAHGDLDAFYVNFRTARFEAHWPHRAPGGYDGRFDTVVHRDCRSRRVVRWEDVLSAESSFGTQVYVHILRRHIWQGLSDQGALGPPYSSFRWTWPHTYMVAKAMFGRPAFYLGEPLLTIFNRAVEWSRHLPRMMLCYLPELIAFYHSLGLSAGRVREFLRAADTLGVATLQRMLRGEIADPEMTVGGYLAQGWYRPRTWRLLARALAGLATERPRRRPASGQTVFLTGVGSNGRHRTEEIAARSRQVQLRVDPASRERTLRPLRVCFVAPAAYPLFDAAVQRPIGGMETRSVLFARELAKRPGLDVHFLVTDFGQPAVQRIDGVTVRIDPTERRFHEYCQSLAARQQWHARQVRECLPRSARFPWFRIARLRPSVVWHMAAVAAWMIRFRYFPPERYRFDRVGLTDPRDVFGEIAADVCIGFGTSHVTAQMVASCKKFGQTSVLFLASDLNLSEQYRPGSMEKDPEGEVAGVCYYALTEADYILVQTEYQKRLLKERFGREGVVIRNPVQMDDAWDGRDDRQRRDCVLWVGRADRHCKQPHLCVELARRFPQWPFVMVMNRRHADVFEEIQRSLPPNVQLIERLRAEEMPALYRRARVFVNTSSFEGCPNALLQAGKYGAPVASLVVDPDGMIAQHGCGLMAGGDFERLADMVQALWHDARLSMDVAERMISYLYSHHELGGRAAELELFLSHISLRRRTGYGDEPWVSETVDPQMHTSDRAAATFHGVSEAASEHGKHVRQSTTT